MTNKTELTYNSFKIAMTNMLKDLKRNMKLVRRELYFKESKWNF